MRAWLLFIPLLVACGGGGETPNKSSGPTRAPTGFTAQDMQRAARDFVGKLSAANARGYPPEQVMDGGKARVTKVDVRNMTRSHLDVAACRQALLDELHHSGLTASAGADEARGATIRCEISEEFTKRGDRRQQTFRVMTRFLTARGTVVATSSSQFRYVQQD